jgi:hypothetical protein
MTKFNKKDIHLPLQNQSKARKSLSNKNSIFVAHLTLSEIGLASVSHWDGICRIGQVLCKRIFFKHFLGSSRAAEGVCMVSSKTGTETVKLFSDSDKKYTAAGMQRDRSDPPLHMSRFASSSFLFPFLLLRVWQREKGRIIRLNAY